MGVGCHPRLEAAAAQGDNPVDPSCPPAHRDLCMEAQAFLSAAVSSLLFSFLVNAG